MRSAPGRRQQIGHQLGDDRIAGLRLAVLAGVAVVRDDRGDGRRRRPDQRVDHDQQLHQVGVGRVARRLNDEHFGAAHRFADAQVDFAVPKPPDHGVAERQLQVVANFLRQVRVGRAGKHFDFLVRSPSRSASRSMSLLWRTVRTRPCSAASYPSSVADYVEVASFSGLRRAAPVVRAGRLSRRPSAFRPARRRPSARPPRGRSAAACCRRRAAQPSMIRCLGPLHASASAGTSWAMLEPAPVNAPAPMRTGAIRLVLLPMRAPSSMTVSYLLKPSQLHVMVPAPMLTSRPMRPRHRRTTSAAPCFRGRCGTS